MALVKFKKTYLDKGDGCLSCGWMSAWRELDDEDFEPTNHPTRINEYRAVCTNPEQEGRHDGYYIYWKEGDQ